MYASSSSLADFQKLDVLIHDARVITHSRMRLARTLGWDGRLFDTTSLGGYPLVYWVEQGYTGKMNDIPRRNRVEFVNVTRSVQVGEHFAVESYGVALCGACASDESNWPESADVLTVEMAEGYEEGLQCDNCGGYIKEPYLSYDVERYVAHYVKEYIDEERRDILEKLGRMAYVARHEADRLAYRDDGKPSIAMRAREEALLDAARIVAGPDVLGGKDKAAAYDDGYAAEKAAHDAEDVLSQFGHGFEALPVEEDMPEAGKAPEARWMVYGSFGASLPDVNEGPFDDYTEAVNTAMTVAWERMDPEAPGFGTKPMGDELEPYRAGPSAWIVGGMSVYVEKLEEDWMVTVDRDGDRVSEESFSGDFDSVIGEWQVAVRDNPGCEVALMRREPFEAFTSMEWEDIRYWAPEDALMSPTDFAGTTLPAVIADLERLVDSAERDSTSDLVSQLSALIRALREGVKN